MVSEPTVIAFGPPVFHARRLRVPTPILLGSLAVAGAAIVGAGLAARPVLGAAALGGALLVPFVIGNLGLAVALWVPLLFLQAVPMANLAGKGAGMVIVCSWAAARIADNTNHRLSVDQRRLFARLALLLAWLLLSVLWAPDTSLALVGLSHWVTVAVIFVVVSTTVANVAAAQAVAMAVVVGALASMAVDLLPGGIELVSAPADAVAGRLYGGAGDPNILAAGLLAGFILLAGLLKGMRHPAYRWAGTAALVTLAAGVTMSGSRGALVSAALTALLVLLVLKRHRGQIALLTLATVIVTLVALSASPSIRERLTASDGGNGRSDLWKVAWSIAEDHPVQGVGVSNFLDVSAGYVRDVGPLEYVDLIAADPHEVHNAYLQVLAENGIVGIGLLMLFICSCLITMWRAARRFEAAGDARGAILARSVLLASIIMLEATFFLPTIVDLRLWVILAVGPALMGAMAQRPVATDRKRESA